jgi:hypothetical protein
VMVFQDFPRPHPWHQSNYPQAKSRTSKVQVRSFPKDSFSTALGIARKRGPLFVPLFLRTHLVWP